jgi:hypothetical protein
VTIKQFAKAHDLKARIDVDGTQIIAGIDDSHVYEYDNDHLGVMYMDSLGKDYRSFRKECETSGMEIHQDGDTVFAATFDPSNAKQAKLAVRVAGCRYPGRRRRETSKIFVNCVALQRVTLSDNASVGLG